MPSDLQVIIEFRVNDEMNLSIDIHTEDVKNNVYTIILSTLINIMTLEMF
jgi:hypothetical protein